MKHDDPPIPDNNPPVEVSEIGEAIFESEYFAYVDRLAPHVRGARVTGSMAGRSGFVLVLAGGHWVASMLRGHRLEWAFGDGTPPAHYLEQLSGADTGDGRTPLRVDLPYASEECDLEAEVRQSHGHTITGLAYGEDTFNFCFENGYELDAMLVPDRAGATSLRVFWERWS